MACGCLHDNVRSNPPELAPGGRVAVVRCWQADQEHRDSLRQYAHVFHHPSIICVAGAFFNLPETHQLGVLLHEVGHLLNGPNCDELDATERGADADGVNIEMRDSDYGRRLEWVNPKDLGKARRYLGL